MLKEIENSLVDLLCQVKEVLDKNNIEFWLDCGTLLGAVRDSKIIPGESDLDLGAWSEKIPHNTQLSIAKELSDKDFKVFIAECHMTIVNSKKTWADINFYRSINEKAIFPLSVPKTRFGVLLRMSYEVLVAPYYHYFHFKNIFRSLLVILSHLLPSLLRREIAKVILSAYKQMNFMDVSWVVPIQYFNNFSTIKFYGMEFKVPAQTEDYLAYRYGKDWRIPRKDWITERDDGAVVKKARGIGKDMNGNLNEDRGFMNNN